jgi:hypothetical protein
MVEHNPPPSGDSPRPPVIPLPVALYVSDELIFELYDGDGPAVDFRSVGRCSLQRRKTGKRQPRRIPQRACAHPRISARVQGPA